MEIKIVIDTTMNQKNLDVKTIICFNLLEEESIYFNIFKNL